MSRARGHWAAIETTRHQRTHRRLGVLLVAAALTAGMVGAMAPTATASPAVRSAPVIPHDKSIPVTPVAGHYHAPTPMPSWHPAAVNWPTGSATVSLPASTPGGAARSAGSLVRAGSLP